MLVHNSPLHLTEFSVLTFDYSFKDLSKNTMSPIEIFKTYKVDIDFSVQFKAENILVFMLFEINNGKRPKGGYKIIAESVSVFDVSGIKSLPETEQRRLIVDSTLAISINNMRGFIAQTTSTFPLGSYQLPVIDLPRLIEDKKKQYQKSVKEKVRVKKSPK